MWGRSTKRYCSTRVCFFFSSRRRHTRSYGDWSSDVCSSDLGQVARGDLEDRDVGRLVDAEHLGGELALVGQLDGHFIGAIDDVRIGEDHAVRADDEAGKIGRASCRERVESTVVGA